MSTSPTSTSTFHVVGNGLKRGTQDDRLHVAAMALQGMLAAEDKGDGDYVSLQGMAQDAAKVADALLAELARTQPDADKKAQNSQLPDEIVPGMVFVDRDGDVRRVMAHEDESLTVVSIYGNANTVEAHWPAKDFICLLKNHRSRLVYDPRASGGAA